MKKFFVLLFMYLTSNVFSATQVQDNEKVDNSVVLWILIAIVVTIIVMTKRYKKRCPKCKKWGALQMTDSLFLSSKPSRLKEKLYTRDAKGHVTRSREVLVPATTKTYSVEYTCKYCQETLIQIESKTYKD